MLKFEFCSAAWIAHARAYLLEQSKDADLAGLDVTFNEVFTDAPAHLGADASGRIGWYLRVADGVVDIGAGVLPDADIRVTCDYQTVLPAARWLSTGEPLGEAEQQALTNALTREGETSAMERLTWMAGLHDAMAIRTQ